TITTLGAPLGALTSNRGGGLALRASSSVYVGRLGSAMGRTVRSSFCCAETVVAAMVSTRPRVAKAVNGFIGPFLLGATRPSLVSIWLCRLLHQFDIAQLPGLVEPRLEGAVEAEVGEPPLAGRGLR